jgi:hypothetical protein
VVGTGAIVAASSIARVTGHGITEGQRKGGIGQKAKDSEGSISGGRASERAPQLL